MFMSKATVQNRNTLHIYLIQQVRRRRTNRSNAAQTNVKCLVCQITGPKTKTHKNKLLFISSKEKEQLL